MKFLKFFKLSADDVFIWALLSFFIILGFTIAGAAIATHDDREEIKKKIKVIDSKTLTYNVDGKNFELKYSVLKYPNGQLELKVDN